jgi:hypothetical protein
LTNRLGIEEIGVSIEEPFSTLPLAAICGSVLTNVRELQATHAADTTGSSAADVNPLPLSASQLVTRYGVAAAEAEVRGMDVAVSGAAAAAAAIRAGVPGNHAVWPQIRAGLAAAQS